MHVQETIPVRLTHNVGHRELHVLDAAAVERRLRELTLLRLQGKDAVFNRLADSELVDVDVELLAEAVGTVKRLVLEGWVPPHVHKNNVVAAREVET